MQNPDIETRSENRNIHGGPNESALSTLFTWLQTFAAGAKRSILDPLEQQLDKERDQLPLWIPVAVGSGVAIWFLLADAQLWKALIAFCFACAFMAFATNTGRIGRSIFLFFVCVGIGCCLIWLRSWSAEAPVLEKPVVLSFYGEIEKREKVISRNIVRVTLDTEEKQGLPPRVRVNIPIKKAASELQPGAIIALRARLMPPAMPALPGAYDFSRRAWFSGLGATGQLLGEVQIVKRAEPIFAVPELRAQLSDHVRSRMKGGAGAIGATLASGDRGAISDADAEAMRRSGLAHLLSISGLHVTAVVGATYLLVLRLLALFPALALRWRLPLVAAGFASVAALGYTLLTGAQVPTIRACVAALLVLVALMMGRSAITLRMIAAGALFVLILWPDSLVGPSFQLSFAAVTAIIALHEHPRVKKIFARRDEPVTSRIGRIALSLFLTGLVVEIALMPIALFHFHKAGLYGAFANIIAIPLTTFVIMPLEALALALDILGLGTPIWWICEQALTALISLAHFVSTRPGAVTMLPTMPTLAFALLLIGGLWICLWRQNWRYAGFAPVLFGTFMVIQTRAPDIYITGDGRHVGIRNQNDDLAMLRTRSGDFIRSMLVENAGVESEPEALEDWPNARCNRDSCVVSFRKEGREWSLLATRSGHFISALELSAACSRVDIVVSERWLPASCKPRWIKADRSLLRQTGGITISLSEQKVVTVAQHSGRHQWTRFQKPDAQKD